MSVDVQDESFQHLRMQDRLKTLIALGERIRDFRDRKGLSQETLAFELDVHRTYIGLIEQARCPSMSKVGGATRVRLAVGNPPSRAVSSAG